MEEGKEEPERILLALEAKRDLSLRHEKFLSIFRNLLGSGVVGVCVYVWCGSVVWVLCVAHCITFEHFRRPRSAFD